MYSFMTLIAQCMFAINVLHCIHFINDHLHTYLVTIHDKYHETMLLNAFLHQLEKKVHLVKEDEIEKPGPSTVCASARKLVATGAGSHWETNPGCLVAWYSQSSVVTEHW